MVRIPYERISSAEHQVRNDYKNSVIFFNVVFLASRISQEFFEQVVYRNSFLSKLCDVIVFEQVVYRVCF